MRERKKGERDRGGRQRERERKRESEREKDGREIRRDGKISLLSLVCSRRPACRRSP